MDLPHYLRDDTADPELGYPGYFSTRLRTPQRPLRILPQWLTEDWPGAAAMAKVDRLRGQTAAE